MIYSLTILDLFGHIENNSLSVRLKLTMFT
jgi:hypothetical protein